MKHINNNKENNFIDTSSYLLCEYPKYTFNKKIPEEIRESARLFYVAMTRAKKRLHITYAESVSGISK